MRVHVVAALLVGGGGGALRLDTAEELALLLSVFLVLAAEVLNTGLEALVDLYTREIDPHARVAKDAAAGSVLVLAVGSVFVAIAIVGRALPQIAAEPGRIAIHAAVVAPLAAAAAALVSPWRRPVAVDVGLAAAGVVLLALLAPRATSAALFALAASAFAVCATTAFARRTPG
jgi:diacylglycerol kinase